ncbi:MAG: transposase [Nitrososphaerota archaeon]|jgi:hypothetical protein|nr:transposase [Nitrososphaerota archaeon]
MDGILGYFGNRLTNAVFWGLNDVVGSIKHVAWGFRDDEYFRCWCICVVGCLVWWFVCCLWVCVLFVVLWVWGCWVCFLFFVDSCHRRLKVRVESRTPWFFVGWVCCVGCVFVVLG